MARQNVIYTLNSDSATVTNYDPGGGDGIDEVYSLLSDPDGKLSAIIGGTNTGLETLSTTIDMRELGAETGRIGVVFNLQLPRFACMQAGSSGFEILKIGSGANGTITLKYMPVQGSTRLPHMLVATVTGDVERTCTVTPGKFNYSMRVFLDYNGSDLLLVAGDSSDTHHASVKLAPCTSPTQLTFARDINNMVFDSLMLYNTSITAVSASSPTTFPYMLWDNPDSGVIATVPVTGTLGQVFNFIDRGFTAGSKPATVNLTSGSAITPGSVVMYVNEIAVPLTGYTGTTAAALVTWLTTTNAGVQSFPFDGKTESIKFTVVSGSTITAQHKRGAVLGQMSFCIRFEGATGNDWSKTVAILGKIPQQFYLPHTGQLNEGVSILGATKHVQSPRSLKITRRDDAVRTIGRVIGSIKNRPISRSMLETLKPICWFGADQAPYPLHSVIWGNPGSLDTALPMETSFAYGITWNRYMIHDPLKVGMVRAPNHRSRTGDCFAAFSLDIPYGKLLRGLSINFVSLPPGLKGNSVNVENQQYEWGVGAIEFPMTLSGNSDYTLIFNLMVAVDDEGMVWRPVPSLATDAVKVTGSNVWKDISFKSLDFTTLKDLNDRPLLLGSRRVHFKLVLANELTAVAYGGLSYYIDVAPKK